MEHLHLNRGAQMHVDAYLEYLNIVGDADNGVMFTEREYAEFKQRAIELRKDRVYVVWRNPRLDLDCRIVGPSTQCFCTHRYRDHATDRKDKKQHCRVKGCRCNLFCYVPVRGTQDVKCKCKHSFSDHAADSSNLCLKARCPCSGFASTLSCSCGDPVAAHLTVFESKQERVAAGRPVDNLAGGGAGYAALGGLTHFASLLDGVERVPLAPHGACSIHGADIALQSSDSTSFVEPRQLQHPPVRVHECGANVVERKTKLLVSDVNNRRPGDSRGGFTSSEELKSTLIGRGPVHKLNAAQRQNGTGSLDQIEMGKSDTVAVAPAATNPIPGPTMSSSLRVLKAQLAKRQLD